MVFITDAVETIIAVLRKGKTMNDLISKQAAIDEVRFGQSYITKLSPDGTLEHLFDAENKALEEAVKRIERLPSVNPQRTGHWIYQKGYAPYKWKCNQCFAEFKTDFNHCPKCGCRMVEPQESEGNNDEK